MKTEIVLRFDLIVGHGEDETSVELLVLRDTMDSDNIVRYSIWRSEMGWVANKHEEEMKK